jgi:hypothetical protein
MIYGPADARQAQEHREVVRRADNRDPARGAKPAHRIDGGRRAQPAMGTVSATSTLTPDLSPDPPWDGELINQLES